MTATAHPIFTDTTWAALGNQGLTPKTAPRSWERNHDLAVHAHTATAEFCTLTFDEWNILVAAAGTGLPVTIAQKNGRCATYVVTQIGTLERGVYNNLRVKTWGFAYPLALGDLDAVTVPEMTYATR